MKNTQKGFIGLLGLLITAALIAYWVLKSLPATTGSSSNTTERSNDGELNPINRAQNTKDLIEKRWADTITQ